MIVVAGESLTDLVPSDSEHLHPHCGGGQFNTARVLTRLGQPVSFLGCISDDALGARLRATARRGRCRARHGDPGVPSHNARAGRTRWPRLRSISLLRRGDRGPELTATDALAALPASFDTLQVGSLGLVLEPIASAMSAVVEAPASTTALVMVDPNIRPSLIIARSAHLKRFHRVLQRAQMLKATIEDLL
jgi:fructokinase